MRNNLTKMKNNLARVYFWETIRSIFPNLRLSRRWSSSSFYFHSFWFFSNKFNLVKTRLIVQDETDLSSLRYLCRLIRFFVNRINIFITVVNAADAI